MTTFQTAELRRWWRDKDGQIWGYVYNDPDQFWDDGELGGFEVKSLSDSGMFYILHTEGKTIFKLNKDDETKK